MAFHDTLTGSNWHGAAAPVPNQHAVAAAGRLAWADLAKGLGIVLVVLMHSTLGVGEAMKATGWAHHIVAFAKPFRMPDFFLLAGMFASAALALPFRTFFDKRVLHFVYFYGLWVCLTVLIKEIAEHGLHAAPVASTLLHSLYEPFSSLWFIYVLPLMALALRAVHRLPAWLVLGAAALLHGVAMMFADGGTYALSSNITGYFALDSLSLFLVFFLIGHYARSWLLHLAGLAGHHPLAATGALVLWAIANGLIVTSGMTDHPAVTLPAGVAGALAVIVLAAVLARVPTCAWLAYLGRKSLVIYVSFTIPMAMARILLIKSGVVSDVGWVSAITFGVALIAPLVVAALVKSTPLAFLYRRPGWARLS